jgi:chromosome segregation ATPase
MDAIFGQSSSDRVEDEAVRKTHAAEILRRQNAALDQAKEQRRRQQEHATNRLRVAKEEEAKMIKALDDAREELNVSGYQLAEAKSNLEKAKGEIQLLNNKELELVCYPLLQRS